MVLGCQSWVIFAGMAGMLAAQSTTQTIQGLVTDPSGAVIPQARVMLTNVGTGVSTAARTNDTGNYSFQFVPVGNYQVRCEAQGFRTETVRGLRVETAAQVRQDFPLHVGETTESVEVVASMVLLNRENPTVGGVIELERIRSLPLAGGNIAQLAVLVPGVQFGERTGRGDGLQGFPIPGQSFSVSANGQREYHQVVSLDGVDAKDPRTHITNFVPAVEAIEEFKIQTNAYTAEYGFGGGAQVSITTRSGTNEIHGAAGEFLRNSKLDAEDYFLNFEGPAGGERLPKDTLRANGFGVALNGPLIRNKTFWAYSSEHRRIRRSIVQTAFFPHDSFRNGDFSELLRGTINPATGRLSRAPIVIYDPLTGEPFTGNIIPRSRLHAGALNVIERFLPRAEFRQADPFDFTARRAVPQPINANQYFGRVDHYFQEKNRVFARLTMDRSRFDGNIINPNFPLLTKSRVTNLATQWIHTFNQNAINELRVGSNISNNEQNTLHNNENFDTDSLGIGEYRVVNDGNRKLQPREQGAPNLGFTIAERIYGQDQMDTIQLGDHISLVRGKHNLKMGGEVYRISMERSAAQSPGRLTFGANETGYNFASLLLGYPARSETPEGAPFTFPRATRVGTYLQDDWKLGPRVTVNIGLRFDYSGNPRDAQGLWRTFDFPGLGTEVGRGKGFRAPDGEVFPTLYPESVDERGAVKLWKQNVRFFMPRLGIAYRPSAKWVLRLGAGWFDNINHLNNWTILNLNPPKSGVLQFDAVTDAAQRIPVQAVDGQTYMVQTRRFRQGDPVLTLSDPFLARSGGRARVLPVNTVYVPPDTKDGDVWKWSLDIQRELPFQTALTLGYIGSKGSHVGNSVGNYNDALPSPNTNVQARRPYPRYYDPAMPERGIQSAAVIRYLDSYGESFYHAVQAKLDRRFGRGVAFGLAYTFSKAHGDGENGGNEAAAFQNPRDRRGSRGRFRFDQTHTLVAHYVWEMPGKSLAGPLKRLFGGWQANGIVSIRSGFPFTVGQSAGDLNVGSGPVRPDLVGQAQREEPNRALWFAPQAFRRVTCNIPARQDLCHYGSAGYNILEAPWQKNLDASLFRNFNLTEKARLQFRTEFINTFNTPYFGEPQGIGFATNDSIVPDGVRMGEIRSLRTAMRHIQFGMKLYF